MRHNVRFKRFVWTVNASVRLFSLRGIVGATVVFVVDVVFLYL